MTIRIEIWPDEASVTPNDQCYWYAAADVNGQHFEERSRRAAAMKLARTLRDAGIPDGPAEIYNRHRPLPSGGPSIVAKSFYKQLAAYTIAESAKSPIRTGKFVDIAARVAAGDCAAVV